MTVKTKYYTIYLLLQIVCILKITTVFATDNKESRTQTIDGQLMYKVDINDTIINVGGYKLHFNIIKGKGIPILFESGNGSDGTIWKSLMQQIYDSTGTTLIAYDRAGLGLSGIDTNRIDLLSEVKGLEVALRRLGYSGKIFLVNHSYGSVYSTLFAHRNKRKVIGSVFIDPALPCNYTKKRLKEGNETVTLAMWDTIKKEAIGLYYALINYEKICDEMSRCNFPYRIPATVIAAEYQGFLKTDFYKKEWQQCIKSFGSLPNHTYVFARNCQHIIWNDNPSLVISEILKLYKKVSK